MAHVAQWRPGYFRRAMHLLHRPNEPLLWPDHVPIGIRATRLSMVFCAVVWVVQTFRILSSRAGASQVDIMVGYMALAGVGAAPVLVGLAALGIRWTVMWGRPREALDDWSGSAAVAKIRRDELHYMRAAIAYAYRVDPELIRLHDTPRTLQMFCSMSRPFAFEVLVGAQVALGQVDEWGDLDELAEQISGRVDDVESFVVLMHNVLRGRFGLDLKQVGQMKQVKSEV